MRKAFVGFCAAATTVLLAVTCANAQQTVKIGLILPYTGQFTDPATQLDNAIKLYMSQHGDTVAGKRIQIIRRDTGGVAPDVAKRFAREFVVNDNVDLLAGFLLTPNALAVADVSEQAKKFMVVMNAATAIITTKSPYIARTSLTLPQTMEVLGAWAYKNGIHKVYSMVSDYGPGVDAETAFHRTFKEAGGDIIGSVRFPVMNPDFSAFVQRAKDSDPEAIFVFAPGGSQPVALAKAFVERGIDPRKVKILGQGEITDEQSLKNMGDAALGIITALHYDYNHASSMNREFVRAYNAAYARNPDIYSIGGYDGMHLIYETLKKTAGNTDADAMIATAKGMQWESPRGPISIDRETRDIIQTVYIRRVEKVGGELRNVEFEKFDNVKDPVKARMKTN